jgi:transposase
MSERSKRYPPELRDRAVRMVLEHQDEYPSQWAAIISIAGKQRSDRPT